MYYILQILILLYYFSKQSQHIHINIVTFFFNCIKHFTMYIFFPDENGGNGVPLSERTSLPGHSEVSSNAFCGCFKIQMIRKCPSRLRRCDAAIAYLVSPLDLAKY